MGQVLSIYLPWWDTELQARRAGGKGQGKDQEGERRHAPSRSKPLLLFSAKTRQEIVARCCPIAQSAGVVPGMTLSEGRAICPEAQAAKFDSVKSRQAMGLLAKWALRFSPVVAVDPTPAGRHPDDLPDGLLLDITGTAHLFGGEALLMTEIAQLLKRLWFGARMAIGPTIGAA